MSQERSADDRSETHEGLASEMGMTALDPYRVLGVDQRATHEAIREAYRALAREFHPDIAPGREAQGAHGPDQRRLGAHRRRAAPRGVGSRQRPDHGCRSATAPRTATASRRRRHRLASMRPAVHRWTAWHATAAPAPPGRHPAARRAACFAFGRHLGWSLGEIARVDPGYLLWLESRPEGQPYAVEIDSILRRLGVRKSDAPSAAARRRRFGLS